MTTELTRRRLLWISLVAASGYFLFTLVLAAFGTVNQTWYHVGLAVYGILFAGALAGFFAEGLTSEPEPEGPEGAAEPEVPALEPADDEPETAGPSRAAASDPAQVVERVHYLSPHGEVREVRNRDGPRLLVEDDGRTRDLDEIVEELAPPETLEGGDPPTARELSAALERWGRVRTPPEVPARAVGGPTEYREGHAFLTPRGQVIRVTRRDGDDPPRTTYRVEDIEGVRHLEDIEDALGTLDEGDPLEAPSPDEVEKALAVRGSIAGGDRS